ncbi:MAG: hypothetical protein KME21_09245 [Desmonostoc vinosum HA7617-LM4]|jgi:hypothetical protein|nr:hypothetical protein [Desmonostoc vinosum HA7617-LM4]
MLQTIKMFNKGKNKQNSSTSRMLTAPILAMAGWLTISIPVMAATASYSNDYRACVGRLLSVGVTPEAAPQACATALRPRDLASCVVKIAKQTQIAPADALASCRKARRPQELSTCVVGISDNTKEPANTAVLDYCGRSLLPVTFAKCVVGLRSEVDLTPAQALDTCIDAGDRASGISSSSTPPTGQPGEFNPTFETTPVPTQPNVTPTQPSVPQQPNVPPTQPSVPQQPNVPPTQPGSN